MTSITLSVRKDEEALKMVSDKVAATGLDS
jgi:hypothetical protein